MHVVVDPVAQKAATQQKAHRAILLVIIGACICAAAAGGYYYWASRDDGTNVGMTQAERERQVVEQKQRATAQPLRAGATLEEQSQYYTDALWLLIRVGDNTKTADYYVQHIAGLQIKLGLDIREAVLQSLLKTGHNAEAKAMIGGIIADYQAAAQEDPETADYLKGKLQSYQALQGTL